MTTWFTSDLHLNHRSVAAYRGFESSEEHDEFLCNNWRQVVKPDDCVWVLGDLQLREIDKTLETIKALPGGKNLITGNHDPCHPMHRNSHKFQRKYLEAFESVQAFARKRIEGLNVLMSHFPYSTDHTTEVRYTQYRLRDEGRWLLHGHTHGLERLHGHEIHVGVDAWDGRLVPLETIQQILRENKYDANAHQSTT